MPLDPSFTIKNNADITRKLTLIWKQGCLITASFGEPKLSFITAITYVDPKKQILNLDCDPNEQFNQQLLSAKKVTFNTAIAGVQVEFSHQKITLTSSNGHNLFSFSIPDTLYWLEQRKFYRVRSPLSNPATCQATVTTAENEPEQHKEFDFKIHDLSISGLCLIHDSEDGTGFLENFMVLTNCRITFPEMGEFIADIEIRNQHPLNINKPDKAQLIGVQLLKISSANEAKIQRYMQAVERENRKKS